jgi:hypothetical protein
MLRSYVKGALSFVLPQARDSHSNLFPVSAEYSYSLFLRHCVLRSQFRPPRFGESVAELGPGSSLGFGMAALIAGASRYRAYDLTAHFDAATNLAIFDALVALFQARAPIPHEGEFSRIFPFLDDYSFPASLGDEWLSAALAPKRLAAIRNDIEAGGGNSIKINLGMVAEAIEERVDWLASHSVLEHVDDLAALYRFLEGSLRPDGVMTHLIDFSAHGLTAEWNGHWATSDLRWWLLRGRRLYLINRQPLGTYLDLFQQHGMRVIAKRLHQRVDGLLANAFQPAFAGISSADARTHMAFLVCVRQQDLMPSRQTGLAGGSAVPTPPALVLGVNFHRRGLDSENIRSRGINGRYDEEP